jgi:predicted transcriptional regulator
MSTQEECKIRKVSESATVQDAAKILAENPCGGPILVTKDDDSEIIGVIDMMDIIKAVSSDEFDPKSTVVTMMSRKFVSIGDNSNIDELITQLRTDDKSNKFRPILENGAWVGGVYLIK